MAANSSAYCARTSRSMCSRGSPPRLAHSSRGHGSWPRRTARRCAAPMIPGGVLGAEQLGEDPLGVVVVVDEQQQVAEADQDVGPVARLGQRVGAAVHIADDVDPHAGHRNPPHDRPGGPLPAWTGTAGGRSTRELPIRKHRGNVPGNHPVRAPARSHPCASTAFPLLVDVPASANLHRHGVRTRRAGAAAVVDPPQGRRRLARRHRRASSADQVVARRQRPDRRGHRAGRPGRR